MFRLRKSEVDTYDEYKEAEVAYRKHLKSSPRNGNGDLWKFFYWDFFHDGDVLRIDLSPDLTTLVIKLTAPNIRLHNGRADDFEYIRDAKFEVAFKGVYSVTMKRSGSEACEEILWASGAYKFRYAEINTAPAVREIPSKEAGSNAANSLLIELVGDSSVWLEVVFNQVNVTAAEPLAFSLMESDPKYKMPTYDGVGE